MLLQKLSYLCIRALFQNTVLVVNRCDYSQAEVEDWASCGDSVEHLKELLSHNHFIGAFDEASSMVGFSSMNKDLGSIGRVA